MPPTTMKRLARSILLAALGLLAVPPLLPALENEVLFGTYVDTLRNLETRGGTFSYRVWLSDWEEPPDIPFSFFYPRPLVWGAELTAGRVVSQ